MLYYFVLVLDICSLWSYCCMGKSWERLFGYVWLTCTIKLQVGLIEGDFWKQHTVDRLSSWEQQVLWGSEGWTPVLRIASPVPVLCLGRDLFSPVPGNAVCFFCLKVFVQWVKLWQGVGTPWLDLIWIAVATKIYLTPGSVLTENQSTSLPETIVSTCRASL